MSTRQQIIWCFPLFVVFLLTTPTLYFKIVGIGALNTWLGVPVLISWVSFEFVGLVVNFIGADKITFGIMSRLIRRISA